MRNYTVKYLNVDTNEVEVQHVQSDLGLLHALIVATEGTEVVLVGFTISPISENVH